MIYILYVYNIHIYMYVYLIVHVLWKLGKHQYGNIYANRI